MIYKIYHQAELHDTSLYLTDACSKFDIEEALVYIFEVLYEHYDGEICFSNFSVMNCLMYLYDFFVSNSPVGITPVKELDLWWYEQGGDGSIVVSESHKLPKEEILRFFPCMEKEQEWCDA